MAENPSGMGVYVAEHHKPFGLPCHPDLKMQRRLGGWIATRLGFSRRDIRVLVRGLRRGGRGNPLLNLAHGGGAGHGADKGARKDAMHHANRSGNNAAHDKSRFATDKGADEAILAELYGRDDNFLIEIVDVIADIFSSRFENVLNGLFGRFVGFSHKPNLLDFGKRVQF
ncbi:MAG: hypothetical protein KJ667_06320 [Alphaproteobacteria bacterium]|nr:hypothetical protein [Alphaproteobacteria bacterium]